MKRLVLLVLALCLLVTAALADDFESFQYEVNEDGVSVTITKYTGSDEDVIIPEEINGMAVTGIADGAFADCTAMVSLVIPDCVATVGEDVFTNCGALTDIAYPCAVSQITEQLADAIVRTVNHESVVTRRAIKATCTKAGKTAETACSVCGEVLTASKSVRAKGHTPVTDAAVEATCTMTGLTEGSHCSVCGEVLTAQQETPMLAHTPETDAAVAATCTKTGLTEGSHCSVCSQVLVAQQETPMIAHTPVTDAAVAATCTKTGLTEGSHCSVCSQVLVAQQETPMIAHTPVTDAAVAATCTTDGKTEGSHCSVCEEVLTAQETVKAPGHVWGEYVSDGNATCVDGTKTAHCTRANCTATDTVTDTGSAKHTWVTINKPTGDCRYAVYCMQKCAYCNATHIGMDYPDHTWEKIGSH